MKDKIIKSFTEALKDTYGIEIEDKKFIETLEKELFKNEKLTHPEIRFFLELLEKIDMEDLADE